jgi:hypothetical protein
LSWYQRNSGSASRYSRLQYTLDGVNFTDADVFAIYVDSVFTNKIVNLSAISGAGNNPKFGFRIVSEWENSAINSGTNAYVPTDDTANYSSAGTVRFEMVTVNGTLIPGANTRPGISTISNQTIRVTQSSAALPFAISDAEDSGASLVLAKGSSDPAVIAESGITFGGSGNNRTVTVTAGAQTGSAMVTIYVTDTGGRSNSTTFAVTVLPLNTAPVISSIAPTNTLVNTASSSVAFTVGDMETPAASLGVSGVSMNTALLPNGSISFGGTGSNRTVTLTPTPGQTGVAPLSITVSDGTNTASTPFSLMVTPSASVAFYDPFSYADGAVITNSGFMWDNRSGTVGQCQATNGELQVVGVTGEDVVGTLAGGPYARSNGIVLYAAFKAKLLNLPKVSPGYFAHFVGGASLRGRVYIGTTNALAGTFRFSVANGSDTVSELNTNLSTNMTYTVVTRYNIDNATTTLWLNPNAESDPGVTATDSQTPINISGYGFRQDSSFGATLLIDDLQVGLSFAAVTSQTSSAVPLTFGVINGQLVLSWNSSGLALQSAPSVTGTYTNVPGAVTPFTNNLSGPSKFFRLRPN